MGQISDLNITKADGTTAVVYSAMVPSSGDRVPAIFRKVDTVLPGNRATVQVVARWNAARTARRVEMQISHPYVKTVTDGEVSESKSICSLSFVLPQDIPESEVSEHVNDVVKLLGSSVLTSTLESGYAPT